MAPRGGLSPDNNQMNLLQDGRIWILQFGQALCAYQGEITRRPLPGNVTPPGAKALCLDREGNIWITNGTLVRVPALGMVRVHAGPGAPPAEPVWRILRDPAGRLWVTGQSGLYRQDDSGWRVVPGVAGAHGMEIGPDGWLYVCERSGLIRVEARSLMVEPVHIPMLPPGITVRRGPVIQGKTLWAIDALGRLLLGSWDRNGWTWTWINSRKWRKRPSAISCKTTWGAHGRSSPTRSIVGSKDNGKNCPA